jgi:hypothetical protein
MLNLTDIGNLNTILNLLGLTPALSKPIPGLGGLVDKLNPAVAPLLTPLAPALQPVIAALPPPLGASLDSLTGTLTPLGSTVVGALSPVAGTLAPIPGLANPVVSILGPVLGGAGPIAGTVTNALGPLTGVIPSALKQTPGTISGLGLPIALYDLEDFHSSSPSVSKSETTAGPTNFAVQSASDPACTVLPYKVVDQQPDTFKQYDKMRATIYRYRQQQSVNLGSWFVLEQWMVPSMFKCASGKQLAELDVASGWGTVDDARQLLENHWDNFITEEDFQYLASIGIK